MRNKLFIVTLFICSLSAGLMIFSLMNTKESLSIQEVNAKNTSTTETTTTTTTKRERTIEAAKENETVYNIDDNNKISWGNLCFSVENKQLFIYLNSYNNKYKTTVKNVDYMYFVYNNQTKEGTIVIVTEDDTLRYTFKDTDVYTSENLKDLIGTVRKITQ